jgi:hypothetical protein
MSRWFQFSLRALLVWAAIAASAGALAICVRHSDSCGFLLAFLGLTFFVFVAIRETKRPAHTLLGCLFVFFFWPILLFPILLLLAALGVTVID